ncbi:MAG: Nif3-like dinuclear metal center hexameric protein [Oscillospiraceae bacterium]|nr:Nif3-like dinuclear metal center hexameric protein [Oscillospiraceae bacterium]
MNIGELYDYLDKIAPFNNQSKTDNSGLIVGDRNTEVKRILVCLDVTNKVVVEAVEKGIDLIIAHHPLMYRPISKISSFDPLHALVKNNINLIAVHTNLDVAAGGVVDLMLKKFGFPGSDIPIIPCNPDGTGYGRITELDSPVSAKDLAEKCKTMFDCTVVRYVDAGKAIKKVGVTSGSANELVELALNEGCDALVCGEVSYNRFLFAADYGISLIEAGHFHTEDIYCDDLVERIKSQFKDIEIEKSVNSVDVCEYV